MIGNTAIGIIEVRTDTIVCGMKVRTLPSHNLLFKIWRDDGRT